MGALLWSYVIARFVDVIVQTQPDAKAFRSRVNELNRFIDVHKIDSDLACRLREYFIKAKHVELVKSYNRVYHRLSATLSGEVAVRVHGSWFKQLRLLDAANNPLKVHLAHALQGAVFAPSEKMPKTNVYAMHRGIALVDGLVE